MPFTATRFPVAWALVTTAAPNSRDAAATTVRNMGQLSFRGTGDRWVLLVRRSRRPEIDMQKRADGIGSIMAVGHPERAQRDEGSAPVVIPSEVEGSAL